MQTPTTDNAWLKADNWREVLEEPESLPPEIRNFLQTQNQTAESWLGGPDSRQWITDELKATIRDRDDSVPVEDGDYSYWQRFTEGAEHPDFLRRTDQNDLEILLCGDERAANHPYYDIGAADHSPNHELFAVTEDRQGSERYTLTLFQAGSQHPIEPPLTDCRGDFEWSTDSRKLLYTRLDENQRPSTVWCHTIGTQQTDDRLVYQLEHPGRFIGLGKTSSDAWITIDIHDHQTNQSFLLPADLNTLCPIAVTDWIEGLEYELEHADPYLIIRGNHGHEDFALYRAPLPTTETRSNPESWDTLWIPKKGALFSDYEVLENHWIIEYSEEGCGRYLIAEPNPAAFEIRQELTLSTSIHDTHLDPLPGYHRDTIRMRISTPAMPPEVREINLTNGNFKQLKVSTPPNGHDESNYIVQRSYGISGDGQRIPLTVVHHRDVTPHPESPVLLTGYGAYGMSLTPGFSASRRTLLTRGVIHVTAHVRGGMENGYQWYRAGRMADKDQSFNDFIGAAETLIRDGWTSAGNIILHGGSAGGLLVGTTVMRRPELFKGVIADVPFVDVLETMLDADLPLTPPEWPEWGNPIESMDAKRRLGHFSPTQMVENRPYPCILATAGLTDPRVTYWEPARWIHRLQAIAEGGPFLLYTELNAGHGGPSGRYAGLDDIARIYQVVVQLFDLPKEAPYAI